MKGRIHEQFIREQDRRGTGISKDNCALAYTRFSQLVRLLLDRHVYSADVDSDVLFALVALRFRFRITRPKSEIVQFMCRWNSLTKDRTVSQKRHVREYQRVLTHLHRRATCWSKFAASYFYLYILNASDMALCFPAVSNRKGVNKSYLLRQYNHLTHTRNCRCFPCRTHC